MWLRKRVKALELNADCSKGMHDHLSGEIEKLAGMVDDLFTQGDFFAERVKGLDARADGLYAGIRRNEEKLIALEKRLAELEPELEQYKLAMEEAERQERLRNDGMAAIFGYEPVTMRGGGDGNE